MIQFNRFTIVITGLFQTLIARGRWPAEFDSNYLQITQEPRGYFSHLNTALDGIWQRIGNVWLELYNKLSTTDFDCILILNINICIAL